MKVYHGSTIPPEQLEGGLIGSRQATTLEGSGVPDSELKNAIYTTPKLGYAIAMAARPEGRTEIDDLNRKITFDNPEAFDPEKEIYIYELETDGLPEGAVDNIDERQIALNLREGIKPVGVQRLHAKVVMDYYELTNYKKEGESIKPPKDWNPELRR